MSLSRVIWVSSRENLSLGVCEQHMHRPHRLISAFVIRLTESNISRLATSEISIFYLVFVAEQAGLNLTVSETLKKVFLCQGPYAGCKPKRQVKFIILYPFRIQVECKKVKQTFLHIYIYYCYF